MTEIASTATNTPAGRLLDMLVGWAEWTADHKDTIDPNLSADELFDLYQEAGGLLCDIPEDDPAAERRAIISFIVDRVMPTVLRGTEGDVRQAAA